MQGGIGLGGALYAGRRNDQLQQKRDRLMREKEKRSIPVTAKLSLQDLQNINGTPSQRYNGVFKNQTNGLKSGGLSRKNSDTWSPEKSMSRKNSSIYHRDTQRSKKLLNYNNTNSNIEELQADDSLDLDHKVQSFNNSPRRQFAGRQIDESLVDWSQEPDILNLDFGKMNRDGQSYDENGEGTYRSDMNKTQNLSKTQQVFFQKHQKVVILKKSAVFKFHSKRSFYDKRSLYIFSANNPIRYAIVWLVDWKYFEAFILLMILMNSATLVFYDYNDRDSSLQWNQFMDSLGLFFTIIFALECALKIVAYGFVIHRKAYLRVGWNLIDFAVVVSGILEILPGSVRLKSLRVLRVLRPLRSINAIPGLKKHVTALIQSIPDFFNVTIFLLFIFLLFAILGTHQYQGVLYNQCRLNPLPETPDTWAIDTSALRVCTKTGLGLYTCPNNEYCGNPSEHDIDLLSEGIDQNPIINYGITTFNDVGSSLLGVFQIVTTDGWTQLMLDLMDGDIPFLGAFYCIMIVVVGSYFLMNLILAVIIQAFINIQKREIDEEIMKLESNKLDEDMQELQDEEDEDQLQIERENAKQQIQDIQIEQFDDEKQNWDQEPTNNNFNSINNSHQVDPQQNQNSIDLYSSERNLKPKVNQSTVKLNLNLLNIAKGRNQQRRFSVLELSKRGLIGMDDISKDMLVDVTAENTGRTIENIAQGFKAQREDGPQTIDKDDEKNNNVDLSFLRPMAMKRKVVNLFSKQSQTAVHLPSKQNRQTIEEDLNEDASPKSAKQNPIEKQSSSVKKSETKGMSFFLQQIAEQKYKKDGDNQQDQDIDPNTDTSKVTSAFRNFLDKKREEQQTKEEFFQDLLQETKDQYLKDKQNPNQPTSLRQLASLRLGLKVQRQQQDLSKHYRNFKTEYRAEKNKIFKLAFMIQKHSLFSGFISFAIVVNTVILSLDKYPENVELNSKLENVNILFTVTFISEMLIKMIGLGLKSYFIDPFNSFDCLIVLSSVIDLFVSYLLSSSNGGAFTALRAFRLLRIFKLAKSWKKLQQLLKTIWKTLKDVSTFSILLFLFIFVYSLLGMEMFAFKAKFNSAGLIDMENGIDPPSNFNNFLEAFTTVFVVLTNDGWSGIYFNYYRATGSIVSTIFFLSLIIIGQKILLNLFLAILLENFDEDSLSQEIKQKFEESKDTKPKVTKIEQFLSYIQLKLTEFFCLEDELTKRKRNKQANRIKSSTISITQGARITPSDNTSNSLNENSSTIVKKLNHSSSISGIDNDLYLDGKSLYLLSIQSKFRQFIFDVVTNSKFDYFIIIVILISSVQLALENPLNDPNGQLQFALNQIDVITTSVFSLESFLKILAFGLIINGRPSYLRNPWNMLDFIIIIFSIISLTPLVGNIQVIKVLRVTRPLRLISRNKGLKVAVKALAKAIPSIANVTIITLLFFLIFGIIATSYFKGKFFFCNTTGITLPNILVINQKWECINAGGTWMNSQYGFDNILDSVQTMFQMSSTSGWSTVMYSGIAATEIDYVMVNKNNVYWVLFFIFFIIVGGFFLLNLFVGVVISTFNREKDKIGGNNLLTDNQKEWIDTRLLVINSKPQKKLQIPQSYIRKLCFKIQNHRSFDVFIFICILLNTLILTLKWYQQPASLDYATDIINYIFTAIFAMEAVIKITALGRSYFRDGWNIFDFVIVMGSFLSVFLTAFTSLSLGGATTIIRAFRISRVFRLVKKAQSLRLVFNTFLVTLPALANVGGLLLLLLYLYSVLGVFLFADVKRNGVMNDVINFENFFNAFLTLFVISTGDAWDQIMDAFTQPNSITYQCINFPSYLDYLENQGQTAGCGLGATAMIFFYSYVLFVNLIFLNLFIAIILQGFEDTQRKENRMFNNDSLAHFRKIWSDFDPEATTFIPIAQLKPLLFKLGLPLGFDQSYQGSKSMQEKFIISLDLPTYNNFQDYQFLDVLDALSLRLMVHENFIKKEKEEKHEQLPEESKESNPDIPNNILRQSTKQREENFKEQGIKVGGFKEKLAERQLLYFTALSSS
eukprot:403365010